ncbi:MAG: DUF3604 domain-containing protein [Gammaproteobacteria bacterium]|nr:DUF3604 domain-containing protein [Gammaproteobacteria bacterium]
MNKSYWLSADSLTEKYFFRLISLMFISVLLSCSDEQAPTTNGAADPSPAIVDKNANEKLSNPPSRNPYFGDLHVHAAYSLDSYINFNPVDPDKAYRFAKGEEVTISGGRKLKLTTPLDFAAVTEHGEYLGELSLCLDESTAQYNIPLCRDIRNEKQERSLVSEVFKKLIIPSVLAVDPQRNTSICPEGGKQCLQRARSVWQELQEISNTHNIDGEFTTFVAYEWTGNPLGNNLHRNIIFRNKNVLELPVSHYDANTPELLWQALDSQCNPPCELLAIPHNSNQSNGQQFPELDGQPETLELAKLRGRLEPLAEIIQAKGESECHTGVATNDEFCAYEKLNRRKICTEDEIEAESNCYEVCDASGKPQGCIWENSYIRNALKTGLQYQQKHGTNPYKFGLIGSTDTHNGTPGATDERNYVGHHGAEDGSPEVREELPAVKEFSAHRMKGSGGLAGVWAEENTRDSIFSALKRKETFATSGTRMILRFFGGWDFSGDTDTAENIVNVGYQKGVPMGADLPAPSGIEAPEFLFWAMQAGDGNRLQRVQIVKAWVNENGTKQELTYDVACADGLVPDAETLRCPDNGAKVNLDDCSVSSDKGASELIGRWRDPEFELKEQALYYLRVLENPSCRWSTYEAIRENKALFDNVEASIQERAWSSPIWYTP